MNLRPLIFYLFAVAAVAAMALLLNHLEIIQLPAGKRWPFFG
jgi:hypothetical protein